MARNITSPDTDLTIAPSNKCALCVDRFFTERDSAVQHLAAVHSVDDAVLENAAKLVLSQVQRSLPAADISRSLKAFSESSGETERIDPKSNKAKVRQNSTIYLYLFMKFVDLLAIFWLVLICICRICQLSKE